MRKLLIILIIIGLFKVLQPLGERAYRGYRHLAALDQLAAALQAGTPSAELSSAIGMVIIEKKGFRAPLFYSINQDTLEAGVVVLEGSAEIGRPGNTIATAHRSYILRHHFKKLSQLEPKDIIVFHTYDGRYYYEIISVTLLNREDVFFLTGAGEEGARTLTLFTGYPLNHLNPPFHLVIRAKMLETPSI
jgi:LPXTG-site transpeptidase (sortase) family protein